MATTIEKTLFTRLVQKHDTVARWQKVENTFIPMLGEIIIYDDAPEKIKIGDGKNILSKIPFTVNEALTKAIKDLQSSGILKGEPGERGPQGPEGKPGPAGMGFKIYKIYKSVSEMNTDFNTSSTVPEGGFVIIASPSGTADEDNGKLYLKTKEKFNFIVDMSGINGIQGPKGDNGAPGQQGPRGEAGTPGATGPQGLKGNDGNPGKDGKTPIKGVDYFTEAESQEIAINAAKKVSKSSIGLDKVNNTADSEKRVLYAAQSGQVSWENITNKPPEYVPGNPGFDENTIFIFDCGDSEKVLLNKDKIQ